MLSVLAKVRCLLVNLAIAWVVSCCAEGSTNTASWFQWHGPDRAGTIPGSSGWPPKELWRTNVGFGVSAPLLVNSRVYVMGWREGR
ncbi:MAG TPA: hypothetical protein VL361_11870 [Candidatus Limnocylindrales bacterium]|nr:hypothetical protein [Candidatus Limnocylindrales bacterium]